jgi:hypothetical protein
VSGVIERPHPGQKAAVAGIAVSQRGQAMSCVEFGGLYEAPDIIFLSACFTDAVDLKGVPGGYIAVLAAHLLFKLSHFRREKFYGRATRGANHVVMASPIVLVLIARNAIVKCDFAGQSAVGEEFQGPVHSGETDVGVFLLHQLVQFVGREMFPGFEKGPQNRAPLFCLLQTDAPQVSQENLLGLAHVLGRDARLIVDSFLQHG